MKAPRNRPRVSRRVSTSKRIGALKEEVRVLERQIHPLLIERLVDLRLKLGLITEEQRGESKKILSTLQNDGLRLLQADLSKVLNSLTSQSAQPHADRGLSYVA